MKTAIKRQEREKWVEVLPIIMLGTRTACKEDLTPTLTEMIYGKVRLPGKFFNPSTETRTTNFVKDLQQRLRNLKPTTATRHGSMKTLTFKALKSTPYAFVRNDAVGELLQPTYDGPYRVIKRHEKNFQIEKNERKIKISASRLKPAHRMPEGKDRQVNQKEETQK